MRIRTIAHNTFKETIRDRILYSLVIFAMIMIGLSYFLAELSVGDFERIVINFGLTCVLIFGAIIAIFIGITLVSKEVEKKTIYSIISKPVSRFEFILGKFFGLSVTLLVTTVSMTVGLVVTAYIQSGNFHSTLFLVSFMIYLELLILIAVSIMFSSFTTPTLSAIFTLSVFFIGHMSNGLKYFSEKTKVSGLKVTAKLIYYVIPNLENFNLRNTAVYGTGISVEEIGYKIVYFLAYVGLLILFSHLIFSRRNIL
jgi:ABC-type transport system involved in multi-copper enzyme maturation permease subunit